MQPVTSAQIRMARAALAWTVRKLADVTGLHRNTISNIETEKYVGDPATLDVIRNAFVKHGIDFIDQNGGGPGVRLRRRRQRMEENY